MRNQDGFTLVEILVSLAIFATVVIGAVGVLAADAGGFLSGFPTSFVAARVAKDITAASVYLQAFQEFVASKGSAYATPGTYCLGGGCSPVVALPSKLSGYPTPPSAGYQLDWTRLDVVIQLWYWDPLNNRFSTSFNTTETLTRVQSTLTWQEKGVTRTLTVDRFIP